MALAKLISFKSLATGLVVAAGGLLGLLASVDRAEAFYCPKPCWVELECCCITPCPVQDGAHKEILQKVLDNIKQANNLYGVKMPGMDSSSSLKSPVNAQQVSSAGINALQQAVRNVVRGPDTKEGLKEKISVFTSTIPENEAGVTTPAVHADKGTDGSLTPIENKASELDKEYWSTTVLSNTDQKKLSDLRYDGARIEASNALAYAYVKRQEISQSSKAAAALEKRLGESLTVSDEVRLNGEARSQLISDYNQLQELMSYVVSAQATGFVATADGDYAKPARMSSNAGTPPAGSSGDASYDFAKLRSACEVATNNALQEHNDLQDINELKAYMPQLMQNVDDQQARSNQSWSEEGGVISLLSQLYQDPTTAWTRLTADLQTVDRTSYIQQARYGAAKSASNAVVQQLFAQTPTTRYGTRLATPGCTLDQQKLNACLPFTSSEIGGSYLAPIGTINSYYSAAGRVEDAYNRYGGIDTSPLSVAAVPLPPLPGTTSSQTYTVNGRDVSSDDYGLAMQDRAQALGTNLQTAKEQASVMIQYRQEAAKRKLFWDAMRRGDGGQFGPALDPSLRTELASTTPACFDGPVSSTASNLTGLANWFDVDPSCAHRTWAAGPYAGEEISHTYLGGTDSSIWQIQNDIADYNKDHTGRPGVEKWANGARQLCTSAAAAAPAAGRSDTLTEIQGYLSTISAIMQDTANVKDIALPNSTN